MSEVIISVRQVGKMYMLYRQPQDRLKQALFWRLGKNYGRTFWALNDISFDICQGESVGIIGRNGSGKSTLLQIIAGTLQPSTGQVQVRGRVAALLELGSGFNPEYTGRENVLINGAILGLSESEIAERFDDIAAFADIGDFINQPVKLYSSGMVMRLAFAVQAVVQKDLLIVDEALAVGDEAFQRKCFARLEDFQEKGGTVLLVSHSAQTIVRQCQRCLFLHQGALVVDGPSKPVTDLYERFCYGALEQQQETLALLKLHGLEALPQATHPTAKIHGPDSPRLPRAKAWLDTKIPAPTEIVYGNGLAEIYNWEMCDEQGHPANVLVAGQNCSWRYRVRFSESAWKVSFGMMLKSVDGIELAGINNEFQASELIDVMRGQIVEVSFNLSLNVAPGTYYLNAGVSGHTDNQASGRIYLQRRVDVYAIHVIPPDNSYIYGLAYLRPEIHWRYL